MRRTGYLERTAPNVEPIDLEFYESPENAQRELDEAKKQEPPSEGASVGNVMLYDSENNTAAVSQENLEALQKLLS